MDILFIIFTCMRKCRAFVHVGNSYIVKRHNTLPPYFITIIHYSIKSNFVISYGFVINLGDKIITTSISNAKNSFKINKKNIYII